MSDDEAIMRFFEQRAVYTDKATEERWYGTLKEAIEAAAHKKRMESTETAESGNYLVRQIFVRVHHSPSHIEGWMAVVDPRT
jgi:hypothetical protein